MLKAAYTPYNLIFKEPAMTSRATMTSKLTYFVKIWDTNNPDIFGLGECALFEGLSYDDRPDYITRLESACKNINDFKIEITKLNTIAKANIINPYHTMQLSLMLTQDLK